LKILKTVTVVCEKRLALYGWIGLAAQTSMESNEASIITRRSRDSYLTSSESNFSAFLGGKFHKPNRYIKLSAVHALISYCRINTEQIALWRWRLTTADKKRSELKHNINRLQSIALKVKLLTSLWKWNTSTVFLSNAQSHSSKSLVLHDYTLREVFGKAKIRWYFSLKEIFVRVKGIVA
jgi:hypothetical protein